MHHYHYNTDNGLVYHEPTELFVSKNGEMWLRYSSSEWISKFDGVNWTHFHLPALGLPPAIHLYKEYSSGLFFYSIATNLVLRYSHDGKWFKYNLGNQTKIIDVVHTYETEILDAKGFTYRYDESKDSFIKSSTPILWPRKDVNYEIVKSGRLADGTGYIGLQTNNYANSQFFIFTPNGYKFLKSSEALTSLLYINKGRSTGLFMKDGIVNWISNNKSFPLITITPSGKKAKPVFVTYVKMADKPYTVQEGIIALEENTLVWHLFRVDSLGNAHHLFGPNIGEFPKHFVTQTTGNKWWYETSTGLSTTDNNVLFFDGNNPNMISGLHTIVEDKTGRIWMGGYGGFGGFSIWDQKNLEPFRCSSQVIKILPGAAKSNTGTLYFFSENGMYAINNNECIPVKPLGDKVIMGFMLKSLSDHQLALGLSELGLGLATESNGMINHISTIGKKKGMLIDNVISITEDKGGRIWMGRTSQGIAIYDRQRDTAVTYLRTADKPNSFGAISTCMDEAGTVWFGIQDGVSRLPHADKFDYLHKNLFEHIQRVRLPGNDSSIIMSIMNIKDYIVIGSQRAVYFIDKKYKGNPQRIFTLTYKKDLPGNGTEQNAMLLDSRNDLWIGTQEGALRIRLNNLFFDTTGTQIYLKSFIAGGKNIDFSNQKLGTLPSGRRNISVIFSSTGNITHNENMFYDIIIYNESGDTFLVKKQALDRIIDISYIPPDKYFLKIIAYKNNIISDTEIWNFSVPKLLVEKQWFWILLSMILLFIPLTYLFLRRRYKEEREKMAREKDALRIKVLSNIFNPHFINNSLHWLQSRYRKDPETTTIVGRLSENVDLLFENTQNERAYHSLNKELQIVGNYIKIQQVRFSNSLDVTISVNLDQESLNTIQVPAMMLQIHTENAIEKGIRKRLNASRFSLEVNLNNKGCSIIMEDDGRGRLFLNGSPKEMKRKGSTMIMNDLIALYNRYNAVQLTIRYDDHIFGLDDALRYGTRVHFFIPKNFNYGLQ